MIYGLVVVCSPPKFNKIAETLENSGIPINVVQSLSPFTFQGIIIFHNRGVEFNGLASFRDFLAQIHAEAKQVRFWRALMEAQHNQSH